MSNSSFIPASLILDDIGLFPSDLIELGDGTSVLDRVGIRDVHIAETETQTTAYYVIVFADELSVSLPGLVGISFVFGGTGQQSEFTFEVDLRGEVEIRLIDASFALRFASNLLKPVKQENGRFVPDTSKQYVEIAVSGTISIDGEGFRIDGMNELSLAPCMISDSGVVIEASGVVLDLSRDANIPQAAAAGLPVTWMGVLMEEASIHLPPELGSAVPEGLSFQKCFIGSGGFTGKIEANWDPAFGGAVAGVELLLKTFALDFQQNSLVRSEITGTINLPFFDEPLDIELGFSSNGALSLKVANETGLAALEKPGVLALELDSIGFEISAEGFAVSVSGKVKPLFGDLDWPTFDVKELSIDSEGNVHLDGGWLDLPNQYAINFYGFQFEITQLGFGKTDDGGKWVGFSGGLKLVDGLSAGASVEGLRISWYEDGAGNIVDVAISFSGVGVEFEVPDVLRFKGEVSYRQLEVNGEQVNRFDGAIKLELLTLGLEIDAVLVVGSASGAEGSYTFFAIYLGVELPAGIPLWSTGLALYGMAGLFALQMEPDKHEDEPWYGIGPGEGWYKRPEIGVTDLADKWINHRDSLALGGGITIGTVADNGFTFSGKMLLVLVFPGPIILLEGKANMLKARSSLDEEPIFRALAVLDGRAGTFLFGLDAQYKYGPGGELIDIRGSVEAFFSFTDADAWHLYLGQREPREKRIRADIIGLFEANAYLMLDAKALAFGAWVGYDKEWRFGPLRVSLEAWIEGNAIISWKPAHLYADLWLHGQVALSVFGFGLGLSLDALFAADVFDPFHVLAEFSVGINLPWPLPDFDATITLEWGPEPTPPLLPMPLQEVAVEHFKVTTSWPLKRGALLLPVYDADGDGLLDDDNRDGTPNPPGALMQPGDLGTLPVVPLDARPHITFGRSVHDDALVGVNPQPVVPAFERIGDPEADEGPARVRYGLKEVALEKLDGGAWQPVARKAATFNTTTNAWEVETNPAGVASLYGSWAPVPALPAGDPAPGTDPPVGNVKLWLWSRTPFDYTRHTGRAWDEWFTDRFSDYPCIPEPPDREICCDFEDLAPGDTIKSPYICRDRRQFVIVVFESAFEVAALQPPVAGKTRALCPTGQSYVDILLGTPAEWVEVTVVPHDTGAAERTCIDFRDREQGRGPNPLEVDGARFLVLNHNGQPQQVTQIQDMGLGRGLNLGFGTHVALPCPATDVRLRLSRHGSGVAIKALDAGGNAVDGADLPPASGSITTVALEGQGIVRLEFDVPQNETLLQEMCFVCEETEAGDIVAVGFDAQNQQFGPFVAHDNVVEVEGDALRRVRVSGRGRLCLVQICANIGPDPSEKAHREEMAQHLVDELAHWQDEGEVLEPHSTYRLKIASTASASGEESLSGYSHDHESVEYAYFRTEGPPGLTALSVPQGHPNPDEFEKNSGLSDLAIYVKQTVPPTVPASGEQPLLPRPVYRAYDVGVEWNEDYVDLMYRIAYRDLGLYLYDNNNRPVRDAQGRLIVLNNRWGVTEDLTVTESEERWISILNASDCAMLDPTVIPHDKTLTASAAGQVLDPDALYEARLIPLLLHEDFSAFNLGDTATGPAGTLGGWRVVDQGANSGPSQWRVGETGVPPSRYVEQTSNIWGGSTEADVPAKPGTLLVYASNPALPAGHPDQPSEWTDYRFSVFLRSADDDAMGVVFRYQDPDNYYRFSMDRERSYRRLVRFVGGDPLVLAEDEAVYRQDQDYLITVEAIGDDLAIYQDGELAFRVTDPALDRGAVGLYCWASEGARFTDVRVDDYRVEAAPVVYRFEFVTSNFSHFVHHLHSYQDETWGVELDAGSLPDADLAALVATGAAPGDATTEGEERAYTALAEAALGPAAHQNPDEVRASRVNRDGETVALLVESPEPIDWKRTDLAVARAGVEGAAPGLPGTLKMTGVTFGNGVPADESVSLLLREAADLTGHQVQLRSLPGALDEPAGNPVLFEDSFDDGTRGLLFDETFGPNALDHYTIVDEGTTPPPSSWQISGGHILQTSNIWGGSTSASPSAAAKPGTMAITGSPAWGNVRVTAGLRSTDNDAIGVVFQYRDADNYYRFSMDRERSYRRLVKMVDGTVTVLWEDGVAYDQDHLYELVIEAHGDRLLGFLDQRFLFSVQDGDLASGQVGLYCWANVGAHFEKLLVEALETPPLLWEPQFANVGELTVVDAAGAVSGPSQWDAAGGVLTQSSNIHVPGSGPEREGTYAVGGSDAWEDVQLCVRLRSTDDDAIGVMFRYQDDDNYYRFSMDRERSYRRLIKKVGGAVTVLWQDAVAYTQGHHYDLTIRAEGHSLTAYLDGVALFDLADGDLGRGAVGFYCWGNTGAEFDRAIVTDRTRRLGPWTVRDGGTISRPSVWRQKGGALLQTSNIHDGSALGDVSKAGTHALAGGSDWADYRLTVRLRSDDDDAVGVLVRYVDDDNYYRLSLDSQRNYRRLVKKENGTYSTLWEDTGGLAVGEPFTLTLDVAGPRLAGYLGESQLFAVSDSAHATGRIGLYCWGNTGLRVEHVEVRRLPQEAYALFRDRFALGDMSAWSIVDEGTNSAPSNWTIAGGTLRQSSNIHSLPTDAAHPDKKGSQIVAGDPTWTDVVLAADLQALDDDAIGVVFRYQDTDNYYRFSMDRERSYRRLVKNVGGTFTVLWEDDVAYESGRTYRLTVVMLGSTLRGYIDDVPVFLVEDADLAAGRIGLYVWANQDARFSNVQVYPVDRLFEDWLLDEDFGVEVPGRWQFVDDGDQGGPSAWAFSGGELQQTSNIWGGTLDAAEAGKPGTHALTGEETWTDYRVTVRLISDDNDAIGLVFRYLDEDNHYRFSMDRERSYRRLIKRVGGAVTVLWEDSERYVQGRPYLVTVDCIGHQLAVYVDGVELVTLEDADLPSGGAGLYCWGNTGARFTEVRVAEPVWSTYYVFSGEERLPAGTRLRLYAGNAIAAPPGEPNTERRFVASLDEGGRARLRAPGAELRVVDAAGSVGHSRRFLPDDAYEDLANVVKVLRKADGTGLFLFLPAATPVGSRLSPGQVRLAFTYRRDNTAVDADSIVYQEVGNSEPETAVLDLPWGLVNG